MQEEAPPRFVTLLVTSLCSPWDHIGAGRPVPIFDPRLDLAVIAMRTRRIKLGALVILLPRRLSWNVARETGSTAHRIIRVAWFIPA